MTRSDEFVTLMTCSGICLIYKQSTVGSLLFGVVFHVTGYV